MDSFSLNAILEYDRFDILKSVSSVKAALYIVHVQQLITTNMPVLW